MNPKEIGAFLKRLRNEKGITQEQLAEISEYYDVEIKEILNGERKSENMEIELKETLLKVAGHINEAENILLESIDYTQKEEVLAAILFYQYIGGKDNDFLAARNYSKEEALDGIKKLAEKQGYGQISSPLMET